MSTRHGIFAAPFRWRDEEEEEEEASAAAQGGGKPLRYCSATFVSGRNLKICSRCRATWYVDQKAQKAHWPLHKKSCKKITSKESNDLAACYNANRIFLAITRALPRGGNHLTAAQFRRIREIFDDGEDDGEGHEELDMNMQSFMRGLLFSHGNWGAERLWACPGMTQFMLEEWDAISAENKIILEHFPRGRPTSDYVDALGKTRFSSAQLAAISHFDAAENRCMQAPGSYRFCWLAFNLLMATAMRSQPSMSSVHDGRGTVRKESLVAYAASKRILELWCNKHVRRSCGDAMAPAVSFTLSFLQDEDLFLSLSYCPPESRVFPEGLVCAALAEFAQHGASKSYARKILKTICTRLQAGDANDTTGMCFPRMAYDLAEAITNDTQDAGWGGEDHLLPLDACNALLNVACGGSNSFVRYKVWNTVANGSWDALGRDYDIRAFFHSLRIAAGARIRQIIMGAYELTAAAAASRSTLQDLPGELLNHICEFACDPNAIDISQRLEVWDKTRFPRTLQDKARKPQAEPIDPQEMKRSRDKMRSSKQVMPAELYQEWDRLFGYETPDERDARLAKQRRARIESLRACDETVFSWRKKDNLALVDTMSVEECRAWILGQTTRRDPDGGRNADPPVAIPEGMFTREALGGWDADRLQRTIKEITGLSK